MQVPELVDALSALLAQLETTLRESAVRRYTKECRDDVYADTLAHGGRIEDPFFNFVISDGVAVFTFFENDFSVYAFRCNAHDLIAEMNRFAMSDTDECKAFLARRFQKTAPDVVTTRAVCEHWLAGG